MSDKKIIDVKKFNHRKNANLRVVGGGGTGWGGPGEVEKQAEELHGRLKATIISHTGHEQDVHERSDMQRYRAHSALIANLNEHLMLDMDKKDQELLSLIYTSLSYTNRFEGDPYIAPGKGESPVKHSCHAAADYVNACYHARIGRSQDGKLAICRSSEFKSIARQGALSTLWHDADEVFGEPTTVHSRAVTAGQTEQDSGQGIKVVHYALTLAMHAIEEKQRLHNSEAPLDVFFKECALIREGADVKKAGFDNILDYMKRNPAPVISEDGRARVAKALRHYAVAEGQIPNWHTITRQEPKVPSEPSQLDTFISTSVKCKDRTEGTLHLNHFVTEKGVVNQSPGENRGKPSTHLSRIMKRDHVIPHIAPSSMQIAESNLRSYHGIRADSINALKLAYAESKVGAMLESAKTPLQDAIAAQCAHDSYRTMALLLANGPVFFDRFPEKRDDYKAQLEAAKKIPTEEAFSEDQQRLRKAYYDARRVQPRLEGKRVLPEIAIRQELISCVLQVIDLIDKGEWQKMNITEPGKQPYYGGIIKRTAPLPPEIDLNKPIPGSVQL